MQILTRVYVPSMMPILLETLRISMIFNFTGVMIAEMYASRTGIGHLIANWGENFQMPQLFAGVILLAAVAIAFNETVRWLENRVQHMADVSEPAACADAPADAAIEVARLSHIYAGREGAGAGAGGHLDDRRRRALRRDRRPERLRQDLAA